jgi:enamine deaminase RidA (YjgF/YER057c/UK114 family)
MPKILDAASSLLIDVFGEKGQHTRSAIGVQSLPGNATIETELLIALRDS